MNSPYSNRGIGDGTSYDIGRGVVKGIGQGGGFDVGFDLGEVVPILDPTDSRLGTLYLWLDANDIATLWQDSTRLTPVTANNDPVGAWDDKSGNGRHFLQTTSGNKPLYKTSQDGTAGLKLDGVDDYLTRATAIATGREVYMIWHSTKTIFPGSGTDVDPLLTTSAGGQQGFNVDSYSGFGDVNNPRFRALNGTSTWLNGAACTNPVTTTPNQSYVGSATVGSPAVNTGTWLGVFSDITNRSPDGLKGLIVYTATHTDAQRALVHAWAMDGRYSI